MASIGAWIKCLAGLFCIGASFELTQPLFDFLFALGNALGGHAQHTAGFINSALGYLPILIGLSLILWAFIESTTSEDGSFWG